MFSHKMSVHSKPEKILVNQKSYKIHFMSKRLPTPGLDENL